MARFIIQNQITDVENIKNFDLDRYSYNPSMSDEKLNLYLHEKVNFFIY